MHIRTQIKTLLVALGFCAVCISLLIILYAYASARNSEADVWFKHSSEIANQLNELSSAFDESEDASRQLINLGRADKISLSDAREKVWQKYESIKRLAADNPTQEPNFNLLKFALEQRFLGVDKLITVRRNEGYEAVTAIVQTGVTISDIRQVNGARALLQKEENRLLIERDRTARESQKFLARLTYLVLSFLIISVAALFTISLRALGKQKEAAERFRKAYEKSQSDAKNSLTAQADLTLTMKQVGEFLEGRAGDKK